MASAGYIEYDPVGQTFTLPPEYVPILAQESGPIFLGGLQQMLLGMAGLIDALVQAFQRGGGVAQANYEMCSNPQSSPQTPMRRQPEWRTEFASNNWTRRMVCQSNTM